MKARAIALGLLTFLASFSPALASVTFDAIQANGTSGTQFNSTAGSTGVTDTNQTVGSGTHRALVVLFIYDVQSVAGTTSLVWNSTVTPQTMTLIKSQKVTIGGTTGVVELWGLANPASGNHTLKASWTGTTSGYLATISFSGSVNDITFRNVTSSSVSTANPALTVTSVTGDYVVWGLDSQSIATGSQSQTLLVNNSGGPTTNAGGCYAAGASTVTCTFTQAAGNTAMAGVDVTDSVASSQTCTGQLLLLGAGC